MGALDSLRNPLLFGQDTTPGVVAVELAPSGEEVLLYRRQEGVLKVESRPFTPWLLTTEQVSSVSARWTQLAGGGFCWLAEFPNWRACENARRFLREKGLPLLAYLSPEKQFLVRSGVTLFKEMGFNDLHRLQLDIETEGLSPYDSRARLLLIALSDNRGFEEVLTGDERGMIEGLVSIIRDRDPDVIEGHNLFGFDLPFLAGRAKVLRVPLLVGRRGDPLVFKPERNAAIGGITKPFTPAHIFGRHCIDTLIATQRFDWVKGDLESYNLKEVSRYLGISEPDRVYVDWQEVASLLEKDPQRLSQYALQDVRETRRLSEVVGATDFFIAQMIPDTYENLAVSGTGEKIDALLVREYLRQGEAIPLPKPSRPYPGGYTECRFVGVREKVVKVDIESLYPSIMLTQGIRPAEDRLQIFLPALKALTQRRLESKAKAKDAKGMEQQYWQGLQGAFKILINSFYGYLAGPFHFNDYDAAEQVTLYGQQIVKHLADCIQAMGGQVIEVDTDGIYFHPPEGYDNEKTIPSLVEVLQGQLPKGIRLAFEGYYRAMVSVKIKNYVLVTQEGEKIFKGSALRSRADERFGREFISQAIDLLIAGRREEVGSLYRQRLSDIREGRLAPEDFSRRERITSKTFSGSVGKRWSHLSRRLKVGDYVFVYRRKDGMNELVENYSGDEDREYLADKLYKFAQRLKPLLGEDFEHLCPPPKKLESPSLASQMSLFPLEEE